MNTTRTKTKKQAAKENASGVAQKDIKNSNIMRKVLRMEEVLGKVSGPSK